MAELYLQLAGHSANCRLDLGGRRVSGQEGGWTGPGRGHGWVLYVMVSRGWAGMGALCALTSPSDRVGMLLGVGFYAFEMVVLASKHAVHL